MLVAVPMLATAAPALAGATTRATTAPPPGASLGAPAAPDQVSGVAIPVAGFTAGRRDPLCRRSRATRGLAQWSAGQHWPRRQGHPGRPLHQL